MQESGKSSAILVKAYEVAYALFRIAANMPDRTFAEKLKTEGLSLLGFAASREYKDIFAGLTTLEYFIKFGLDLGIIGASNADILLREIYNISTAAGEVMNAPKMEEIDISKFFSKEKSGNVVQSANINPANHEPAIMESGNPANNEESGNNINGILKAAIRQNTILERIRQSGNCRLKDIQEVLPDCSERTIRYDLQTLMEQNLVERVGAAGPSVYYRIRQMA